MLDAGRVHKITIPGLGGAVTGHFLIKDISIRPRTDEFLIRGREPWHHPIMIHRHRWEIDVTFEAIDKGGTTVRVFP